jgi:CO dehydrogenase/acetyl-CoA synthase alpha subunit
MIQSEEELNLSQEEQELQEKLVPVTESIRYRRRAQAAEKKAADLEAELAETRNQKEAIAKQVESLNLESLMIQKLARSGANDLETAMLIAKSRMAGSEKPDIDSVIEQMKKEKQYLFNCCEFPVQAKTSGAKEKMNPGVNRLEKAARAAANTGSRRNLQEYMKIKRVYKG